MNSSRTDKTRSVILSIFFAGAFLSAGAPVALAQSGSGFLGGDPQQLEKMLTERVRQATGLDLRVGSLNYEVFGSTFAATDVEVSQGARQGGHKYLRLASLRIQASLTAGEGGAVLLPSIEGRSGEVNVPGDWFAQLPQNPGNRPVKVERVSFTDVTVHMALEGGRKLQASGASVQLLDLDIPAAGRGKIPAVTGKLKLSAEKLTLGTVELSEVALEGSLARGKVVISRLRGRVLEGKFELSGQARLTGKRWGAVNLTGRVDARSAKVKGKIKLQGSSWTKLQLSGELQTSGTLPPQKNEDPTAPPLPMRIKIGPRVLSGTLDKWQLK